MPVSARCSAQYKAQYSTIYHPPPSSLSDILTILCVKAQYGLRFVQLHICLLPEPCPPDRYRGGEPIAALPAGQPQVTPSPACQTKPSQSSHVYCNDWSFPWLFDLFKAFVQIKSSNNFCEALVFFTYAQHFLVAIENMNYGSLI